MTRIEAIAAVRELAGLVEASYCLTKADYLRHDLRRAHIIEALAPELLSGYEMTTLKKEKTNEHSSSLAPKL